MPRTDLPDVLARIHRALVPGGYHFASYKLGEAEGRDQFGRFYNFPSPDWLTAQYHAIPGWEIVRDERSLGGGFDGVERDWINLTVRKA